jgi:hypothetical protein
MKSKQKKWQIASRIFSVLLLTVMFSLVVTTPAAAGTYVEGDPDATIEEGQVVADDLFIGGDDVLIAGVVEGDLFAAGENIVISGEVQGNVFAAGQTVTVSGEIDGALMLAGYELTLEDGADIGRNVYFGGFSLSASSESVIGRSIYGGGYQLILDGEVVRDVTAGLAALEINGPVGGDVTVDIGEPTDDSTPMFEYWMPGMPSVDLIDPGYQIDEDMVEGVVDVEVTPIDTDVEAPDVEVNPAWLLAQWMRRRAGEFIALMLVGALIFWLGRDLFLKAHAEVQSNGGMDILWGLLVYFLYIPVLVLLFIVLLTLVLTLGFLTLGSLFGEMAALSTLTFFGVTTLFGIVTGLVAKVLVGYLVGRWLLSKMTKMSYESFWHHFAALALGVFLFEILVAIPVFGWFVKAVVVLIGTGAIFVLVRNALTKSAPPAEAEVVAVE